MSKKVELHAHSEFSLEDSTMSVSKYVQVLKEMGATAAAITDHGNVMAVDDFNIAAKKAGIKPIFGVEAYAYYSRKLNRAEQLIADEEAEESEDEETEIVAEDDGVTIRLKSHLILYAMDNIGLQRIYKALADGIIVGVKNKEVEKEEHKNISDDEEETMRTGAVGSVVLTDEVMEKYFSDGHVIATSACIQGVVGSIYLYQDNLNRKIQKAELELEQSKKLLEKIDEIDRSAEASSTKLAIAKENLRNAKSDMKVSTAGLEKRLTSLKDKFGQANAIFMAVCQGEATSAQIKKFGTLMKAFEINAESVDDFDRAISEAEMIIKRKEVEIETKKSASEEAAEDVKKLDDEVKTLTNEVKELREKGNFFRKFASKAYRAQEEIKKLQNQKLTQEEANDMIKNRFETMIRIFGKDRFYVELQNHGIPVEKMIYPFMARQARKYGLKVVAANDVHVAENTEECFKARQLRRSNRFKKWAEENEGDRELYIKTDEELREALEKILDWKTVEEALNNMVEIADRCNVDLHTELHPPKAKVDNVSEQIEKICRENFKQLYGSNWSDAHEQRFQYELKIIREMGYSDYFYITWDIINVARKIGALSYEGLAWMNQNAESLSLERFLRILDLKGVHPGLAVGLGRGSGAGSIVCYGLRITNVDPFKYDLVFERFLNPERISMPKQYWAFNVNPITQGCVG